MVTLLIIYLLIQVLLVNNKQLIEHLWFLIMCHKPNKEIQFLCLFCNDLRKLQRCFNWPFRLNRNLVDPYTLSQTGITTVRIFWLGQILKRPCHMQYQIIKESKNQIIMNNMFNANLSNLFFGSCNRFNFFIHYISFYKFAMLLV